MTLESKDKSSGLPASYGLVAKTNKNLERKKGTAVHTLLAERVPSQLPETFGTVAKGNEDLANLAKRRTGTAVHQIGK